VLFLEEVKDRKSPNSHVVVEINLDEIPLTPIFDSIVPCLPIAEVSPFHLIFNLNGILIITRSIEVLALSFSILDWKNSWKMPCSILGVCLMAHIVPFFGSPLMTFVGRISICWGLFSLTWKIFICLDMVFPLLSNMIPLVGLDVLIKII
jgi:hypothetical protein